MAAAAACLQCLLLFLCQVATTVNVESQEIAISADGSTEELAKEADLEDQGLSAFAELENLDFKVHRGTGELSADSVLRIGESESGIWSFVNLGAEQSQELMDQSELISMAAGTSGLGAKRSYRSVTAIVGSSGGKVAEWSNLALAGRSFMGLFRNASATSPGRFKIYALEPAQVSITTMRTSEVKAQVLGRNEIQTFATEDNDVVQLSSTGDVIVQSMEESADFLQLAPVDEAIYGYCHELCAIMAFDREASLLTEECADGSTRSYDKSSMIEETYWSVTVGKACRWRSSDGSKIAGTSRSDGPNRVSISLLPAIYFQETTLFPLALQSVKFIGTEPTTCQVDGHEFTLSGSNSVYSAELDQVTAKSSALCDKAVMVLGLAPGMADTVQLLTVSSNQPAAYTKLGNGLCESNDRFNKFTLEEEYPYLTEEKLLDWKLITTREQPGICNVESVDECFHLCSIVSDCKFFATHFAVNCKACLLYKNCGKRGQSLMQDDEGNEGDSGDSGTELQMYDIFQVEESDLRVQGNAAKNLVTNPSFNDGKNGWTEECPPMMYNGKNLTYSCKNEGVSNGVSKAVGGDSTAYHIKGNCWEGSRGGVYQDIKTEIGYTYELTFRVIDGWFSKKNSKEEKSWVEVQSPPGETPVMDETVRTSASLKEPQQGQWQTKGPFKFVALATTSRIFFYSGGTACTNIDDVAVRKTKDPKLVVFSFSTLVEEKRWIVTKGSFVDAENKTDGSSIRALKKNVVVMKPSEAAGDNGQTEGENDMDINTRDLTGGGCSRVSGFVRYVPQPLYQYDDNEVNNGSLLSSVQFEIQEPIGQRVGPAYQVGVTGSVLNAVLDPSPENIRLRVKVEPTSEEASEARLTYTLELQLYFLCKGGGDSRNDWKLNTYEYSGNDGLCISLAARDSVGMGCHEVTCRQNPTSDASLQPCNEEDWAQNFYPDGRLMRSASPADRCLAVDYTMVKSAGNCKPITLKLCDESDPGQRWTIKGGSSPQDVAELRMEDGLVASVPKAASELATFDMKVEACKEQDVSRVKGWNQIKSPMVANLVMAHELSTNFTQRVFGGGIRLVTSIWAEAICPWFFNPPIHTDSKLIKCYTTSCVTLRRMVRTAVLQRVAPSCVRSRSPTCAKPRRMARTPRTTSASKKMLTVNSMMVVDPARALLANLAVKARLARKENLARMALKDLQGLSQTWRCLCLQGHTTCSHSRPPM
ncbi:unnamed protein product [Durusdinium trenchii]|uniref:Uncharacterized protein n=2 Tax=Durusdinium trenchii TaxID=1381693 RepID=A0ABP0L5D8_9DINO